MDHKQAQALIHMKKMIGLVKDKKKFDAYMRTLERRVKLLGRLR